MEEQGEYLPNNIKEPTFYADPSHRKRQSIIWHILQRIINVMFLKK
jgi:hypothetical protein